VPKLPGINHQDAVRALEKAGFGVVRQGDAGLTVEEFKRFL